MCFKAVITTVKTYLNVKVGNYFGKTYVRLRICGCSHLPYESRYMHKNVKIEKRLRRLGNYDPRNLLVGSLFLLKITSLSKAPPSPWLRHPPEPQKLIIINANNAMVAQGSRRCIFSNDTVDELRNRSKGIQVHGNLRANDDRLAQRSRRGTFSIDTVDESRNRARVPRCMEICK